MQLTFRGVFQLSYCGSELGLLRVEQRTVGNRPRHPLCKASSRSHFNVCVAVADFGVAREVSYDVLGLVYLNEATLDYLH